MNKSSQFLALTILVGVAIADNVTCSYSSSWGREFSTTYPWGYAEGTRYYSTACTRVRISCADLETFSSATYKSMAFYVKSDKQTDPRSLIINPALGASITVISDQQRKVAVLATTSAEIDFSSFLYSSSNSERFDYSPKLSIRCYSDDLLTVQSTLSVSSGNDQTLTTIPARTSVPVVCSAKYGNPTITSVSSSSDIKYYTKDWTSSSSVTLQHTFEGYVIITNENARSSVTVSGYCNDMGLQFAHAALTIIGLSVAIFWTIMALVCCCCFSCICLAVYFCCRSPAQNVYVLQQPKHEVGVPMVPYDSPVPYSVNM